jgi:hypothetical protein
VIPPDKMQVSGQNAAGWEKIPLPKMTPVPGCPQNLRREEIPDQLQAISLNDSDIPKGYDGGVQ